MKLLTSQYLHYRTGRGAGSEAVCWLRLYTGPGADHGTRAVAVVTELNTNPGMSVTNGAEAVRGAVLQLLHDYGYREPAPVDLTVYEHYDDLLSYGWSPRRGERYSRVGLDGDGAPYWNHATRAGIGAALGAIHNGEEVPALVDIPDEVILACPGESPVVTQEDPERTPVLPALRRRSVPERLRYHAERLMADPACWTEGLAAAMAMETIADELDDEPARRPDGSVGP